MVQATISRAPLPRAGGLLLEAFRAGTTDEIQWVDVTVGDLVVTVAADAMKASVGDRAGVRLPVSYAETVEICRELDCVAPTFAIANAMFAQAKAQLNFVPLVMTAADSARMTSVEFALKFNDRVEKQLATSDRSGLIAGAWKYWLLHPRLVERGAVNYGFWDKSKKPPRPIQTVGGQHDARHYDYSQLLQPVKRFAKRVSTGEQVDLTELIVKQDKVPGKFLALYKQAPLEMPFVPGAAPEAPPPVDLLATLQGAGVTVVPAAGWATRGRKPFTPEGIMLHHTAGPKKGDAPSLTLCLKGRPDLSGPLCHIVLARSGKVHLIAGRSANHAGSGAPQVLELVRADMPVTGNARDHKYADKIVGNAFFYGIEVENAGVQGDPYPDEQIRALGAICAAICNAHGWSANRVVHHRQWTQRKIDMSYRGDVAGFVAQMMDATEATFGIGKDPSEPMWEEEKPAKKSGKKPAKKKGAGKGAAKKGAAVKKVAAKREAAPKAEGAAKKAPAKGAAVAKKGAAKGGSKGPKSGVITKPAAPAEGAAAAKKNGASAAKGPAVKKNGASAAAKKNGAAAKGAAPKKPAAKKAGVSAMS